MCERVCTRLALGGNRILITSIADIDYIDPFEMTSTTVSITEVVREKLVRIAADLQKKQGRRVDINEAIEYLISNSAKHAKRQDLLERACAPPHNFSRDYRELIEERRKDELRSKRRYRV